MNIDSRTLDEYLELLAGRVEAPDEEQLFRAQVIGRRLVIASIPVEDALEMHETAMGKLTQRNPGLLLGQAGPNCSAVLMELVMAYGLAMRHQLDDAERMNSVLRDEVAFRRRAEKELEEMARELARTNHELEQFSYSASHDLQAPLRQISAFVELLRKKYSGQLDERADEFMHFIVEGADRLQTLVRDLLKFSRAGRAELVRQEFDLVEAVQEVLAGMKVDVDASAGSVEIDAGLPPVFGSRSLVSQVIQNLVANGLRFRRDVPPVVRISCTRTADGWIISVADNGIGIEAEYFERVFEAFQRLHPAGRFPGNGIGLALCKKIIERHGGRIWVESTPGQGSTFRFSLPLPQAVVSEVSVP